LEDEYAIMRNSMSIAADNTETVVAATFVLHCLEDEKGNNASVISLDCSELHLSSINTE
jgi:hypothetical protein